MSTVAPTTRTRFRHSIAVPLAGFAAFVALIPLAGQYWLTAPLLLLPWLFVVWGLRSGVDADRDGLTVRALLGSRHLPWRDVSGFTVQGRRVYAQVSGNRLVPLPAVTPDDVPRLIEAGGGELQSQGGEPDEGREPDGGREPDEPPGGQESAPDDGSTAP